MKNYRIDSAYPDFSYRKVTDISPVDIKMMGVKAIALDLDNTTVAYSSIKPEEGVADWIKTVKAAGIKVIVVTNALPCRAFIIAKRLGNLPVVPFACKPSTVGLKIAAMRLGLEPGEIAMIGDQLFSDVLSANRSGSVSVKVEPIDKEGLFSTYFEKKRALEKVYLSKFEGLKGLIPVN